MNWRNEERPDAEAVYEHALAEEAAHQAVRDAEQLVSASWVAAVLRAEGEVESALQASRRVLHEVTEDLRVALQGGNPRRIVRCQRELEVVMADCAAAADLFEHQRELAVTELEAWAATTRARVAEAEAGERRLAEMSRRLEASSGSDSRSTPP